LKSGIIVKMLGEGRLRGKKRGLTRNSTKEG